MAVAVTALLLFTMGSIAHADTGTYAVYVPKYIRPGAPYAIDVEILPAYNDSVDVTATLSAGSDFSSMAISTVSSGGTEQIFFDPIMFNYTGSTSFKVAVVGRNSLGEVAFNTSTSGLVYQKKFISIFIQTDKAIYQPGQMIKFRAVITTPDLRPYDEVASYKLQDPQGNIILRERNASLTQGVLGSEFKLSRYSTQGEWRITYEVHGYEESMTVSVEEYKLPKFSVEIKPDQAFLHPGSQALTGEVKAIYTFGQPVKGKGYLEVSIPRWWNRDRVLPKIRVDFPDFDGTAQFSISAKDVEGTLDWNPKSYSDGLTLFASVVEKNTGEIFNATATVTLERKKMKIETLAKPDHIKPGLPYTAYLKVSQMDGSDLPADEISSMRFEMSVEYSHNYNWALPQQRNSIKAIEELTPGNDGLIVYRTISPRGDWDRANFRVEVPSYPDKNEYWVSWSAERFESPSNTFLQVSTADSSLTAGETAVVTVATTQLPESGIYRISLVARGRVVLNDLYSPPGHNTSGSYSSFNYNFPVMTEYAPSVYVVVSFIRDDGEFVADTVKINVQAELENEVTMTTSKAKTDAGQPVSITVSADAGSFVGLRAIDQSVLLLKSGNDITRAKIFSELDNYGAGGGFGGGFLPWGRWWWPWSVGGGDVNEVFDNSGFIVLTDGIVYKSAPDYFSYEYLEDYGAPVMFMRIAGDYDNAAFQESDITDEISTTETSSSTSPARSFFPESWIWTDSVARDDGSVTFNYTTPDTITTWELSSFAVSSQTGLGVTAANSKITVFRSFFISLNLPPSIVRGEILNMKTTLFNYFDTEIEASLTLFENEWYDLVIPFGASLKIAGPTRIVTIPKQDSVTIVLPIRLKKVGNAKISVAARTALAGDAVERVLLVKPEGVPKVVSNSRVIERSSSDPTTVMTFDVDIPDDAVEGSTSVRCSVSGNILGSSMTNIGSLLKMPSGCGEQTMLNFAPAVFISKFLSQTNELKGAIKQKSQNYIREGYQNELRYQRSDGSFSAFGSSDRSGSTWLTAFVVKCFIAANDLNPDLVEESKIEKAVRFLLNQQNRDGTFNEPGRVIHTDMQGGVDSEDTTAAYMLIALTEGNMYGPNSKDQAVKGAIGLTRSYLEGRIDRINDIYTLAIVGYALSLSGSSQAGAVMSLIDREAIVETNMKYWMKQESGVAKCDKKERYCPFDSDKPSSSSIEITSYVLLIYFKLGRANEVMPIVRWLVQQRGALGGYHSTQDTVMAIQALATVAGYFSDNGLNMNVAISHSGKPDFSADFTLSQENAIILQMADLPSMSGTITVSATGQGVGDVQCNVGYNLPVGPRADEPFDVQVNVVDEDERQERVQLLICSRINENRDEVINGTGMYVVTFALPSGYIIDQDLAATENPDAKLVELVGEEVTGYFDELPRGRTLCLKLVLIRYAEVAGVKPKMVSVYDYYKPGIGSMRELSLKSDDDVCGVCGSACAGCKDPLPSHIEPKCGPDSYPCANFSDGLNYDSNSMIMELVETVNASLSCMAPNGASSLMDGPPSSFMDGISQYIICRSDVVGELVSSVSQFTISLMVRPATDVPRVRKSTILSIGSESLSRDYMIFTKRRGSIQYWFNMKLGRFRRLVKNIPMTNIPVNTWSLVTIRYNGARVETFINGEKVGKSVRWKSTFGEATGPVTVKIGRSHERLKGHFNGAVSDLNIWSTALSDMEISVFCQSNQVIMSTRNTILSQDYVHRFVPKEVRHCLNLPSYTLDILKLRRGMLDHSCKIRDEDPIIDLSEVDGGSMGMNEDKDGGLEDDGDMGEGNGDVRDHRMEGEMDGDEESSEELGNAM